MTEVAVRWHTVVTDLVTLGTGAIFLLIFFTTVTPMRRGFYCEDESIHYPFKSSTIPNWALYIYGFSIPILVIVTTEYLVNRRNRVSGTFLFRPVPTWFIYMYRSLVDFLFGCAASQLITDIGKYTIGRLRPNFIDVCGPSVDFFNCGRFNHTYIENYTCTSSDNDAKESRVSFPSGHSSFSAYTMLYVAIYIQVKWPVHKRSSLRLVKSGIQLTLLLLAYFTALSRVMDNKHHWSDVSAGALIGAVSASLTAKYVSCLLKGSSEEGKSSREPSATNQGNMLANNVDVESGRPSKDLSLRHSNPNVSSTIPPPPSTPTTPLLLKPLNTSSHKYYTGSVNN